MSCWLKTAGPGYDPDEFIPFTRSKLLSKTLQVFERSNRSTLLSPGDHTQRQFSLVLAYLQLALHAPLRSLPVFAGRDGENEAQAIYFGLQEWSQSRDGRESLWYAGQIFKVAKPLPQSFRRSFVAVAIYHASLTLWVFGIITGAQQKKQGMLQPNSSLTSENTATKTFRLDGEFSTQYWNFVALGEGVPAISTSPNGDPANDATAPLYCAASVMTVGSAILKDQTPRLLSTCLPRFVESLVQLMDELSRIAKSVGFG